MKNIIALNIQGEAFKDNTDIEVITLVHGTDVFIAHSAMTYSDVKGEEIQQYLAKLSTPDFDYSNVTITWKPCFSVIDIVRSAIEWAYSRDVDTFTTWHMAYDMDLLKRLTENLHITMGRLLHGDPSDIEVTYCNDNTNPRIHPADREISMVSSDGVRYLSAMTEYRKVPHGRQHDSYQLSKVLDYSYELPTIYTDEECKAMSVIWHERQRREDPVRYIAQVIVDDIALGRLTEDFL